MSDQDNKHDETCVSRDKYLLAIADLDNLKKAINIKLTDARDALQGKFARELLLLIDAFDNYETTITSADENFWAIKSLLLSIMNLFYIKQIDNITIFDPSLHEVIAIDDNCPSVEETKITKVHRTGYTMNNKTIRPTLVTVTKKCL